MTVYLVIYWITATTMVAGPRYTVGPAGEAATTQCESLAYRIPQYLETPRAYQGFMIACEVK